MRRVEIAALMGAAMLGVTASAALSQEQPATAGGNVSADEATPLPPIIVQSPSEPLRKPRRATAGPSPAGSPGVVAGQVGFAGEDAVATTGSGSGTVGVFTLGQLDAIGGSTITNEAMWTFNKNSLDQAVAILPGVTMHTQGGSRNERDIFVRGFDRFRVPLSIDGVRVYLPADNRLDFNRFLTPDLAEIQVQKGYVSVLNGPGGMGGAINLVSRKPTKAVELEGRVGSVFNGDADSLNSWSTYAFAGTRQEKYYAQISGTIIDQDHWSLSNDFVPVNLANEDGGARDNSETRDWRLNLKAGFTPNATDEYSINFTKQSGEKSAPFHVAGQTVQGPRYWKWPYWDISSVSWLSKTKIGEASYVKTNAYYNTFENLLSSFNGPTFQNQTRNPQDFNSYYDDFAYGGSIEFGTNLIPMNTLKTAIHYRHDNHGERSNVAPDGANILEPWQYNIEDTWSFAAENTFHATRRLDIVTGVSYDLNVVKTAEDFDAGAIVRNPTPDSGAWNGQAAAVYSYSDTGKTYASVSNRTRFPTVFERFSTRFGMAIANPDLEPERTINYELGWSDTFNNQLKLSGAVFYSDLVRSIQPVFVSRTQIQNQNVSGEHYGIEVSFDWDIAKGLRVGGNYTYLERSLDFLTPDAEVEGTPRHEAFLYLAWQPIARLTLTPSLELASDRSSLITSAASTLPTLGVPNYLKTGSYALLNFQAEYEVSKQVTAAIGATNLLDENYLISDGFPEPGRQFFVNLKAKY